MLRIDIAPLNRVIRLLFESPGACYSPDGKWLFANIQSPGVTFAITGPWPGGAL